MRKLLIIFAVIIAVLLVFQIITLSTKSGKASSSESIPVSDNPETVPSTASESTGEAETQNNEIENKEVRLPAKIIAGTVVIIVVGVSVYVAVKKPEDDDHKKKKDNSQK